MRIAILADIHGNSIALDAVLADIQARGGVDGYWVLGDLCALGSDPSGVVERLVKLPNALVIRGNADRYTTSSDKPSPSFDKVRQNPDLLPLLAEVHGSFGWTRGHLAGRGWLEWLAALPVDHRLTLPDGTRVLLAHATPHEDSGDGLNPSLSDAEFGAAIAGADADLICVGHFHMPIDRSLDGVRVINPGSISNHLTSDLRAAYAILSADDRGYHIAHYRTDYDHEAALSVAQHCGNPASGFICRLLKGQIQGAWQAHWDGVTYAPPIHKIELS